jgi:RNA polymerase sigma-70 factor (ECF subfamily)
MGDEDWPLAMNDLSDEALMARVQQGETQLLEMLIKRYERALFAYAQRIVQQRSAAEDAFQETFLRVFRKAQSYRPGSPFRPWLYTICLNTCRDSLRKRSRRPESELDKSAYALCDEQPGPEVVSAQQALAENIRRAVEALPEKQRDVFLLSYYQQLQYPEISEILQIPVGTVKSRMFHASKFLAEQLKDYRDRLG